jgi:hypothetical protein
VEILSISCKIHKTHGVLVKMTLHKILKLIEFKIYNIIINTLNTKMEGF